MKKIKSSRKKTVLLILLAVVLIAFILLRYFFPSYHHESHRGIDYYKDGSYTRLGFGFNRYGKIASKYLPEYGDISEDAEYLDFYYLDSSSSLHRIYKNVFVAVGAKYDTEVYQSRRDEILKMGTNFGEKRLANAPEIITYYRLIEAKTRINGEKLRYIISCSDTDNAIVYFVHFDNLNSFYNDIYFLSEFIWLDHRAFWQDLHPVTTANHIFIPQID